MDNQKKTFLTHFGGGGAGAIFAVNLGKTGELNLNKNVGTRPAQRHLCLCAFFRSLGTTPISGKTLSE